MTLDATQSPSLIQCYLDAWRRYAQFAGRTSRRDYWMFVLGNVIVQFALGFLKAFGSFGALLSLLISLIYSLSIFIPSLSIAVRRLHDTGRTGWWLWISLIPLVGWVWILVLMALPSKGSPKNQTR